MDRDNIVKALVALLREFQQDVSDKPEQIAENTRPMLDLAGFDSLTGINATVHCEERFHVDADGVQNLFRVKGGNGRLRALSVGEIADRIISLSHDRPKKELPT